MSWLSVCFWYFAPLPEACFFAQYNCSILFANRVKGCKGKTEQGEYIVYGIRACGTHKNKTASRFQA
jgi:hypothetical protein